MNIGQTLAKFPKPIHAERISKNDTVQFFFQLKLCICPLLQNQNRPEQHFISFIRYKTGINYCAYKATGCGWAYVGT